VSAATADGQAVGEWPRYGRDSALTGRSPLKGRISKPRTVWSYSAAGQELSVDISRLVGQRKVQLNGVAIDSETETNKKAVVPGRRKRTEGPLQDLDGSGILRAVRESFHERWAKILPEVKGWQRAAWNHTWTDEKVCRLQLFAYDQGFANPRLVWQSDPPEDTIFQPLNIVYDVDGDGTQEVCVAAHYRVMIFDGITGRKETELRYHHSRPYGWFGLADVDADGQMELITIGDFQSHIDVLGYDRKKPEPQRLSVIWRRDIEQNIEDRKKWPQVPPQPVVDVTGDKRLEIVLNLFNDIGDGQWHTVVLDGPTGMQLQDFPRRFLQGTTDVDGDAKAELFLIATDGALVPAFGRVELVSLAKPSLDWSLPYGTWATGDLPALGTTWSTTASQGMRQLFSAQDTENRTLFIVAERTPAAEAPFVTSLKALRFGDANRIETVWEVTGFSGDVQFIALTSGETQEPMLSIRLQLPQDITLSLVCSNAQTRLTEVRPLGVTPSTPIAARLRSNGPVVVIAEAAAQQITALLPPASLTNAPTLVWRRPGRGMSDGSRWLGPVAADLKGDGGSEVVVASQDSSGRALLVAYGYDGSIVWQQTFEHTPGAVPIWNVGALTFWWPGNFRTKDHVDIFVNTRRGPMHSDVGHLLDGRTGVIVWSREKASLSGQFRWGYAGIPPAVADLDNDGRDELICLYPVCFWIADGRTGELKHGVELASRKKLPAWAAYGEPIICRFTDEGAPTILLDSQYILALLDTNGAPLWHGLGRADFPTAPEKGNVGQTTATKHALVDFDGDGRFEIASAGYGDGVRAIDARDGKVLWSLPAPTPTCHRVAAVDIDGHKGDELLLTAGNKLFVITGDRAAGRILWEWTAPATLSMPAIADTDGDGFAEILLQSADGVVHCIGGR
jgi:hypothetical protein